MAECKKLEMDNLHSIKNSIVKELHGSLPKEWHISMEKEQEIPYGHYWNLNYEGVRGYKIVLQGGMPVSLKWKDDEEQWHDSNIARETLTLWFMPSCYKQSWKRFFNLGQPVAAKLFFSSEKLKIYSMLGHQIIAEAELARLISIAKSTKWPDSPAQTGRVSWKEWRKDLKQILAPHKLEKYFGAE